MVMSRPCEQPATSNQQQAEVDSRGDLFNIATLPADVASAGSRDTTWCCTAGNGSTWSDGSNAPATTATFSLCYFPSSGDPRSAENISLMKRVNWAPDNNRGTKTSACGGNAVDFKSWGNQASGTYYLRFGHAGNLAVDDITITW